MIWRMHVCAVLLSGVAAGTAGAQQATDSTGPGCLPGNWILDNTALFVAMREAMQASRSGTDFRVEGIEGDYVARIDPDGGAVDVTWNDWVMTGQATTRDGTFPVRLRLDGLQRYDLTDLSDDAMALALTHQGVDATVSFAGMTVTDPQITIPALTGGAWTCHVDRLTVTSEGREWPFARADW